MFTNNRQWQGRPWAAVFVTACILLMVGVLSVRLAWHLQRAETGWQAFCDAWRNETAGWVARPELSVGFREPPQQAEFWLREIDRITSEHPQDARLAMGAALVLDSPCWAYRKFHYKLDKALAFAGPMLDGGIAAIEADFERNCRGRCLELAARATQLQPENVQWWRLRAMLFLRSWQESVDASRPLPGSIDELDLMAQHDPGNALYSYLAAWHLWKVGAEIDGFGDEAKLTIRDANLFDEGVRRFEHGLSGRFLNAGDDARPIICQFVARAGVPPADRPATIRDRNFPISRVLLIRDLWQWQGQRAKELDREGSVAKALAEQRKNLRMIGQFQGESVLMANELCTLAAKDGATYQMKSLAEMHPEEIDATTRREIDSLREVSLLENEVAKSFQNELGRRTGGGNSAGWTLANGGITGAFAVYVAPAVLVPLLLLSVMASLVAKCLSPVNSPVVGVVGQVLAMIVALLASMTLFGLAPAEIISRDVQKWSFSVLLLLAIGSAVLAVIRYWRHRHKFQCSLRTMLVSVLVFSLLCSFFSVAPDVAQCLFAFPQDFYMPPRGVGGVNADVARAFWGTLGPWTWGAIQWSLGYGGQRWAVLFWAAMVVLLYWLKTRRSRRTTGSPLTWQQLAAGLARSLGRPAMPAFTLLLIVYLAMLPAVIDRVEKDYQQAMFPFRDPEGFRAEADKAIRSVRSNEAWMAELRERAKGKAEQSTLRRRP
jgi:hypothetical protein